MRGFFVVLRNRQSGSTAGFRIDEPAYNMTIEQRLFDFVAFARTYNPKIELHINPIDAPSVHDLMTGVAK